jgi:hypothetical protein
MDSGHNIAPLSIVIYEIVNVSINLDIIVTNLSILKNKLELSSFTLTNRNRRLPNRRRVPKPLRCPLHQQVPLHSLVDAGMCIWRMLAHCRLQVSSGRDYVARPQPLSLHLSITSRHILSGQPTASQPLDSLNPVNVSRPNVNSVQLLFSKLISDEVGRHYGRSSLGCRRFSRHITTRRPMPHCFLAQWVQGSAILEDL